MQFEIRKIGKATVVHPATFELDYATLQKLQFKIIDLLNDGVRAIILDMKEVQEIDSAGVSALIHIALNIFSYPEGKFACIQPTANVENMLLLTRAENLFPILHSEEEALKTFFPDRSELPLFLFVGKDSSTYDALKEACKDKADAEIVSSLGEIKEKVKKRELAALILGPPLSHEDGIKAALPLAVEKNSKVIALVTSSKEIRNKAEGLLILEEPLKKEEASALVHEILQLEGATKRSEIPISEALFKKYAASLPEKLEHLGELVDHAIKSPEKNTFEELVNALHKLAGSAGSYGYIKAGELCKNLEVVLKNSIHQQEFSQIIPELIETFKRIKFYFNITFQSDSTTINQSLRPVEKGTLFLVSKDPAVIDSFQKVCEQAGVPITIESNVDHAVTAVQNLDHKPELFFADKQYPDTKRTGLEIIHSIKEAMSSSSMRFGLIVAEESLEDRLHASAEGIEIIIKKPIPQSKIENLLDSLLEKGQKAAFRVLVVDDMKMFAILLKKALQEWMSL